METTSIVPAGKVWIMTAMRNSRYSRQSMDKLENRLRWIKYNYFIDDYLGFAIKEADLDPVAVPESQFMGWIRSLDDEELFWVGRRLLQLQSYDKALNALELGVARNYKADTANYHYGLALLATNEFTDAVEQWKRAVRINPGYLEVHLKLGKLYYENSYFAEALEEFQIADSLKPNDDQILLHIAESLYNLERYNQSYSYAKRAHKLNRKDPFAKSLLNLLKERRIKYLRKKFPEK
jgi:tetratricopeptide (TPR) repeat protein